jgi:hypothetical protein
MWRLPVAALAALQLKVAPPATASRCRTSAPPQPIRQQRGSSAAPAAGSANGSVSSA